MTFGGWSIEQKLFGRVLLECPPPAILFELGSGEGTTEFINAGYRVYSVENDENYIGKTEATYIHAPIIDKWYDANKIKDNLPEKYDCLLIDGPLTDWRANMAPHLWLFNLTVPIFIDDFQYDGPIWLATQIKNVTGREYEKVVGDEKSFAVFPHQ